MGLRPSAWGLVASRGSSSVEGNITDVGTESRLLLTLVSLAGASSWRGWSCWAAPWGLARAPACPAPAPCPPCTRDTNTAAGGTPGARPWRPRRSGALPGGLS